MSHAAQDSDSLINSPADFSALLMTVLSRPSRSTDQCSSLEKCTSKGPALTHNRAVTTMNVPFVTNGCIRHTDEIVWSLMQQDAGGAMPMV